jgi:hypothetical protein
MLKIVATPDGSGGLNVGLAGQVIGPWVDEVRRTCAAWPGGGRLTMDLEEVSFVDRAGAELLRALQAEGIVLRNCSPFVVEQLKAEGYR